MMCPLLLRRRIFWSSMMLRPISSEESKSSHEIESLQCHAYANSPPRQPPQQSATAQSRSQGAGQQPLHLASAFPLTSRWALSGASESMRGSRA